MAATGVRSVRASLTRNRNFAKWEVHDRNHISVAPLMALHVVDCQFLDHTNLRFNRSITFMENASQGYPFRTIDVVSRIGKKN